MRTIKAPNGKTEFIRPNFDAALYEELDDRVVGRLKNLPCYWDLDGTCWSFNNSDYNLMLAPNHWYEAIGSGVLCWVQDNDTRHKTITLITKYDNTSVFSFCDGSTQWKFAEPLTPKEVAKYIAASDTTDSKWRVPSIQELMTLLDYTTFKPASKNDIKAERYWSSTNSVACADYCWIADFNHGHIDYRNRECVYYTRCVRDTTTGLEWSEDSEEELTWNQALKYADKLNANK